jgi:hypothetical protein
VLLDLTQERLQAEWWFVRDFKTPSAPAEDMAIAFSCQQSAARLVETRDPTLAKEAPGAAPT